MEDVKPTGPVDQTQTTSSPSDQSNVEKPESTEDKVAYETYKKILSEKKNAQTKLEEMKSELEKLRTEKLQAEGKKDELLEDYKTKYETAKKELTEKDQKFAWSKISSAIETEALKHGCLNTKKFLQLLNDNELSSLELDDNYSVNEQSLKSLIEQGKKENDFLFKKNVSIADGQPGKASPDLDVKPKTLGDALRLHINEIKRRS